MTDLIWSAQLLHIDQQWFWTPVDCKWLIELNLAKKFALTGRMLMSTHDLCSWYDSGAYPNINSNSIYTRSCKGIQRIVKPAGVRMSKQTISCHLHAKQICGMSSCSNLARICGTFSFWHVYLLIPVRTAKAQYMSRMLLDDLLDMQNTTCVFA